MVILAKKFLTKFTKIWNFIPNMVFGDRPLILFLYIILKKLDTLTALCYYLNSKNFQGGKK